MEAAAAIKVRSFIRLVSLVGAESSFVGTFGDKPFHFVYYGSLYICKRRAFLSFTGNKTKKVCYLSTRFAIFAIGVVFIRQHRGPNSGLYEALERGEGRGCR